MLNRTFQEKKILSIISVLINQELSDIFKLKKIPPITFSICRSISYWNKIPCFLLAKSLLRFSDFEKSDWHDIISSGFIRLTQDKTKKIVMHTFNIYNSQLKLKLLSFLAVKPNWNYNKLAAEIEIIVRKDFSHLQFDFKHKTHIFRHLFASWMSDMGYSSEIISESLGNSPAAVKSHYIHSNLLLNSSKHI